MENLPHKAEIYSKLESKFPVSVGEELAWKSDHIYGEVSFDTLSYIFEKLKKKNLTCKGGVFYDLGSGIGKAVVAAALIHEFECCIGIELLPNLYEISLKLKKKYEKVQRSNQSLSLPEVRFLNADILNYDWTDASFFFINSTCFDEDFMKKVSDVPVRQGTIGISTSKRLDKSKWSLLEVSKKTMSWGKASVFIQIRK